VTPHGRDRARAGDAARATGDVGAASHGYERPHPSGAAVRRPTATCLSLVLLLAACGGGAAVGGGEDVTASDVPGASDTTVACGEASFEDGELATMPTLDTLPDEVLAAVDDTGEPALDTTRDWRVAEAGDDEVVLIRAFEEDEPAAAGGDTHAVVRLGPITGAPNIPDRSWFVWSSGLCSPRLADGAGDGRADLRLADDPAPDDTELRLLVMEHRCASGRSAEGRIDLAELTLTEDQVRVRVSVRPPPGDAQTCQGNPWTPFTVDLGEAVGDRTVVDADLVPPRALPVGTDQPAFDPDPEAHDAAVERALSFDVWPDYTLLVTTTCFCPAGTYEVVVRDGEVVSRRPVDATKPSGVDPGPTLAPSLTELLDRLRDAYAEDPEAITDVAVDESGLLQRVAFDPARNAIDDEIAYDLEVDVDSPGDPVRGG
jgi:hypothetical protein